MTGLSDDPDLQAVLELFEAAHFDETQHPDEGLRERKKRQVRQRISNVATALFLVHGFDNVTVAQVAAAAEVSEQTVFNYFSTKESLFFDRSEPMIRTVADAVGERRDEPLIEVAVRTIAGEIHPGRWANLDDAGQLILIRRFCEVATGSPTLVARASLISSASSTRCPWPSGGAWEGIRGTPRSTSPRSSSPVSWRSGSSRPIATPDWPPRSPNSTTSSSTTSWTPPGSPSRP